MATGLETYRDGTVAVTNGDTTVTLTGGLWTGNAAAGDPIRMPDGLIYAIDGDPTSATELEIWPAYAGTTVTGGAYAVFRRSDRWAASAVLSARVQEIISGRVEFLRGSGAPASDLGGPASIYYSIVDGDVDAIYIKDESGWGPPLSPELDAELQEMWDDVVDKAAATVTNAATATTKASEAATSAAAAATSATAAATSATTATTAKDDAATSADAAATSEANAATSATAAATSATAAATSQTAAAGSATTASSSASAAATSAEAASDSADAAATSETNAANSATAAADSASDAAESASAAAASAASFASKIGYTHRGAYAGGTSYDPYDNVTDQGSVWLKIGSASTNAPPTLPTTSNADWELFAKGSDAYAAADVDVTSLTPSNYTPAGISVEQHLSGIDAAIGTRTLLQNLLINGDGAINQRGATSQADDTYAWDRWYVLTQTAAVGVSTLSNVADGTPSMMRLTQSNATAQRMGLAQIVEGINSRPYRGQKVTFGGMLRCSAAATVRYAVLEWTGTENSVTSDVVLSWTSTTFGAGGFFLASNVTVAATGSLALSANTLTDFALTATLGSSCNNLIVLVWTDATATQTTPLDAALHLIQGEFPSSVKPARRQISQEIAIAQRYCIKSSTVVSLAVPTYGTVTTNGLRGFVSFPVRMRATPTMLAGTLSYQNANTGAVSAGEDGFYLSAVVSSSGTTSSSVTMTGFTADAEL